MKKKYFTINDIPAIIWGENSDKVFIAIHGNLSNKEDTVITILADEAVAKGYQVISFDLPKHGDRKEEATLCKVQNCIVELSLIYDYVKDNYQEISLFGCSLGAYFGLATYSKIKFKQCLFLSPVVDLLQIIENIMLWFDINEEKLKKDDIIETPIGETLYYDYYCFVKENPIISWESPTTVLYGQNDNLCEYTYVEKFCQQFKSDLKVMENGEHFFHQPEQLEFYQNWLKEKVK